MNNPQPSPPPPNFAHVLTMLTPENIELLKKGLNDFRTMHGVRWKQQITEENPELSFIVDLCANYTAEAAFEKLKEQVIAWTPYKSVFSADYAKHLATLKILNASKPYLFNFHRAIKTHLENPFF